MAESTYDPLAELLGAVFKATKHEQVAAIVASFRMHHVVMTVADYNDDLAAMQEWQDDAKAKLAEYADTYGPLPSMIDYDGLTDHPLGFFADETDNL